VGTGQLGRRKNLSLIHVSGPPSREKVDRSWPELRCQRKREGRIRKARLGEKYNGTGKAAAAAVPGLVEKGDPGSRSIFSCLNSKLSHAFDVRPGKEGLMVSSQKKRKGDIILLHNLREGHYVGGECVHPEQRKEGI